MMGCVIGVDVGTSGCKAIAVGYDGTVLADAVKEYPLYQPQIGWNEQDPEDWFCAVSDCLKEVTAKLKGFPIAGIGLSGQMHGMVALDKNGEVIRRAILWNDQRTAAQCETITQAAGGLEGLLRNTNNRMLTGYTGGKILWMKENEPKNYAETVMVLNPKDYLRYRLTGEMVTDVSDASGTGLFDVKNRRWADELIAAAGLRREIFPPFVESVEQTGEITGEAAAATGLPAGTPVFGGGGDAVISTTGMGLASPGRVGVTLGTSGVVATGLPGYADNPEGVLQMFASNVPNGYMAFGCTLAAAGSYQWFRSSLGAGNSYRAIDTAAEDAPAGCDGMLFLPYLTGERCPIFDPDARGAFIGITSLSSWGHFARAVLEGVCFSLRQVYDTILKASPGIRTNEIVVSGGGAVSPLWRQMLADIFRLPVRTVYGSAQGSAFGAALVAGAGCGLWSGLDQAMLLARPVSETLPSAGNLAVYDEQYAKFVRMYDALKWSF